MCCGIQHSNVLILFLWRLSLFAVINCARATTQSCDYRVIKVFQPHLQCGALQMEKRPKKSLSLKKLGQKKLNFFLRGNQDESVPSNPPKEDKPAEQGESDRKEELSVAPAPSSTTIWLSGLCNLGNTCYANSILQVLRFCPHLNEKVVVLSDILLKQEDTAMEVDEQNHVDAMDGCHQDYSEGRCEETKGTLVIQLSKVCIQVV